TEHLLPEVRERRALGGGIHLQTEAFMAGCGGGKPGGGKQRQRRHAQHELLCKSRNIHANPRWRHCFKPLPPRRVCRGSARTSSTNAGTRSSTSVRQRLAPCNVRFRAAPASSLSSVKAP